MVVPDHDFVWRVVRVRAAAYESKDVASEEHLHGSDASAGISFGVEVAAEDLAEGVAVEDSKAGGCSSGEASIVLIE